MIKQDILSAAERAKAHYRHLHTHPELSGEEVETARYIKRVLAELDLPVQDYSNGGFHGDIKGTKDGPVVALRADMDALPLKEDTGLSFASENDGVMHACGHDMHMACLLGTAIYFAGHRDFPGTVRLIFQPNEEKDGGAEVMVNEGVMDGVSHCMGLHVSPYLDVGTFGLLPGFMYAGVEDFKITLTGKGGHAANPELCTDPIVCGGHVIVALQSIVARHVSPFTPAVVTIGAARGGNKHNIIPDEMILEGTIRSDNLANRDKLRGLVTDISAATAKAHGCSCTVEIIKGYVPLINDEEATEIAAQALRAQCGEDAVITLPTPTMGAEDFAYYLQKAPGTFINLGVKNPGDERHAIHTAQFFPDEAALNYGILAEVASALAFMEK